SLIGHFETLGCLRCRRDWPAFLKPGDFRKQAAHLRTIGRKSRQRWNGPVSILLGEHDGIGAAFTDLDLVHFRGIESEQRLLCLIGGVTGTGGPKNCGEDELDTQHGCHFYAKALHIGQAPLVPSISRYLRFESSRKWRRIKYTAPSPSSARA